MSYILNLIISGSPIAASTARKRLRQVLIIEWNLPFVTAIEDLLQAVGEVVMNSYIHGCQSLPLPIRINASYDPTSNSITVEIADTGKGFDVNTPFRIEPYQDLCICGRFIIQQCVDFVEYFYRDNWFVCRLVKNLK